MLASPESLYNLHINSLLSYFTTQLAENTSPYRSFLTALDNALAIWDLCPQLKNK